MWFKTSYSAEKVGCHGCDDGRNHKVSKIEYWTKSQMCSEACFVWTNRARLLPIFIQWKPESNFQRRPREIYWWETFEIWNIQYVLIMGCFLVCFLKKFYLDINTNQILRRGQNWIFQNIAKKIFEQHCLFWICGLLREISISIENLNVDQTKYVPPPTMNWNGNVFFPKF